MCGIAGIFGSLLNRESELLLMLRSMTHRGPDDESLFSEDLISAGMRRLAINDLSGGNQPLYNKDQSIIVIYNGEIYNHREIRSELSKKGYSFRSKSDGEVIAHLYEDVGEDVFQYLDGMFAIAIWDKNKNKLLLGRDIPGEKPLYYYRSNDNKLIFASEIKCFEKLESLNLELDMQAIWDLPTFLWIPEPRTIYTQINALPRNSYIVMTKTDFEIKRYPNIHTLDFSSVKTQSDLIELTRSTVIESIKSRLISDVPVGSFLSGGLDSTIISTIAAKSLKSLDTFTIAFPDLIDPYHGKSDESQEAILTSKIIRSNHHTVYVTANDFYNSLDDFSFYGDQPFAVSSGLGVMTISKVAREKGIKVLLTGDGADECFGGYSWYEYLNTKNKENVKSDKIITYHNIDIPISKRAEFLNSFSPNYRGYAWHYYGHELEKEKLFAEGFHENKTSSISHFDDLKKASKPKDFVTHDKNFYFPNEMLTKADRMNMANSVEGRVPFASPKMLSLSESLTFNMMVKEKQLKWLLRKSFKDIIPNKILDRPKHGFNVPIDNWLKNDWNSLVHDTFGKNSALNRHNIINSKALEIANNMINSKERLNGHTIFSFIMLNKWLEKK